MTKLLPKNINGTVADWDYIKRLNETDFAGDAGGGGGGSATWWGISGTLSDQNDLQLILNDKIEMVQDDATPKLGGPLDADSNKITNLGVPTNDTDAATKKYVDDAISTPSVDANDLTGTTLAATVVNSSLTKIKETRVLWDISFWIGTQAQYNAIVSPDNNTVYHVIP